MTDGGLTIGEGSGAKLCSLSTDKKILICKNRDNAIVWAKADQNKDLGDQKYARQMAGNL